MKELYTIIPVFVASLAMAQTYNYDAASKSLVISGDGSSTQITLTDPITPGSTIPGSSATFGETTSVKLKDIHAKVDARDAIAPVSAVNAVTLVLENTTLDATTSIDGSGRAQSLVIDSSSSLNFTGLTSLLTNTNQIQNNGNIQYIASDVSSSILYVWQVRSDISGTLGGTGRISMENPGHDYSTTYSMGLIKSAAAIHDLIISGNYTVDLNNVETQGDAYIAGIDNFNGGGLISGVGITGNLTVNAAKATAYGVLAYRIGTSGNNFTGEISVSGRNAYGIMAATAYLSSEIHLGQIGQLNIGKLTVTGNDGAATGILANYVSDSLTIKEMKVTGTSFARGLSLANGHSGSGKQIAIEKLTVKATDGMAAGIIGGNFSGTTGILGKSALFSKLQLGELEVCASLDAYGIIGDVLNIFSGEEIGSIKVTSTDGKATGLYSNADTNSAFKLTGKIEVNGKDWASGIYKPYNTTSLELADGATITAQTESANPTECTAIHADELHIISAPNATFTGNVIANSMMLSADVNLTVNGNVYGNIKGESANKFAKSFYKIDALEVSGLLGTHAPAANEKQIQGTISDASISGDSLVGKFINGDKASGTALSWEITENTYFQERSNTAKEKQFAKTIDSIAYTGDSATDAASAAKKQNLAAAIAAGWGFSTMDMSTVAKTAYENAALAEDIYWDTFFKTGRLMETLSRASDENARMQSWEVSARTINRFGTAGGKSDGDEYDYNTYGGMAQIDKQFGDILVGGGVGGWTSKTKDGAAGKSDSDIIALTIYADWDFGYNFDWFGEIYYGRAMNTLKKQLTIGNINADWDANIIGGFTAIRYSWQVADSFSIKPFLGVMLAYNMQDSLETSEAKVDSQDYSNCKGVVGVEASWQPIKNLYLSGRVMYGYEFADCKYDVSSEMLGWGRFSYTGYETSRNSGIAGIGINYQFLANWNFGVSYNAELRSSELNNNINASVGYRF